ncbi:hypothetical protein RGV33_06505 [Pseudomonas sp. Bout1]|uniref:hypothetical protein n=1 Tax=Pseudomonas sp. Bout1 TaxID=3048600 RepID=UPI002AB367EA|nr:hypothetical protein [Pseudomonas sp. Bout1]MDY7531327.1 hypothetical protein [Pseudomonas sp. Bout1]MEB0183192.1 hypothetical protein [Pseudomonas sp. Bout1]
MNRERLDFCVFVAKAMAAMAVIAALIVLYNFGRIEVLSRTDYLGVGQMTMNWPVIFGSLASAIYAVLFAAMMSAVRYACYFAQDASKGGHPTK